MKDSIIRVIKVVKNKVPLVHNITNQVVMNFTANGLYALGAAPVMAHEPMEVAEMSQNADALVLNIGTLTESLVEAMVIAGKAANEKGIPVVFDPVGVGATSYRNKAAKRILSTVKLSLIRGNAGEISALAGLKAEMRGVDATGEQNYEKIAKLAVETLNVPVLVTGKVDIVASHNQMIQVNNGVELLTKVTGTGCLLSSVTAAFLAVEADVVKAAVAAISFYTVAAELANEKVHGPGSFQVAFLDALSYTSENDVYQRVHLINLSGDNKNV
ncbi:hydroxyethylthiazole kinase [Amphibacillus marinus]|uniref:Hydroxyethylthiazole kinase n=1 Tax=Amphibacillus marinus TaxID=872970 RepID=A0A1H8JY48_9BACI|nr:hydroxyethylthiazole kinase [Amphibacillus marinus]SEN85435.1 hydroxyethylthiazole kinase [Amphibacillus marinus]